MAILDFKVQPPRREQVADAIARSSRKTDPDKALRDFQNILQGREASDEAIDPADLDVPLTVSFTLEIRNEARGPLSFDSLGYAFFVNGEQLVVGESANIVREEVRNLVTVTNTFSSSRLSRNVRSLFAQRNGTFSVKGSALIKLPDEIRNEPVPLSFLENGAFSL